MTPARTVAPGIGWPGLETPAATAPVGWIADEVVGAAAPPLDAAPVDDVTDPVSLAELAPTHEVAVPEIDETQGAARPAADEPPTLPRPSRPRIMTVSNQKGGVGKTTTAVNIAAALAEAGLHVLLIDTDPQGNASTALNIDHHSEVPSVYDVLVDGTAISDVIQACPDVDNLWCVPATIDLAGAEIELVSLVARESRMSKAIDRWMVERAEAGETRIDYVIIDCPPSLGLLTINAFVAATEVLIPIQCEYYALEGLSQLLNNIKMIQKHLNPQLTVSSILLTMYDGRTNLASQVADEVRQHFPDEVMETMIPRSVRISEAPSYQQSVITYDPSSTGALSYLEAAAELATREPGTSRE